MPFVDPVEVERRLEQLQNVCRSAGLRMTHQRMEIFREIARTNQHPDAETILKQVRERLPTTSHDTVYRTLASLEEMGLVSRIDPLDGRARFDANCDKHHHFICTTCGCISDIYLNDDISLPNDVEDLGSVESLYLQVRGVCHNCT
ncbi:MAG: transcriptional repressor [Kiritimatiellaceae bacterium]|nr:transcriptional repressor [Kiritimatiellaceae bacterium]